MRCRPRPASRQDDDGEMSGSKINRGRNLTSLDLRLRRFVQVRSEPTQSHADTDTQAKLNIGMPYRVGVWVPIPAGLKAPNLAESRRPRRLDAQRG